MSGQISKLSSTSSPTVEQVEKVGNMAKLHEICLPAIELANQDYVKYYDAKRIDQPDFKVGDSVLFSLKNTSITKSPVGFPKS